MGEPTPPSTGTPHIGALPLPRWRSFRWRILVVVLLVTWAPVPCALLAHALGGATGIGALGVYVLELVKLCALLTPVAVALAAWLGWRTHRSVAEMRAQAWNMVPRPAPAPIRMDRQDEFGDLALAVNALLMALDERRRTNLAFAADLAHEFKNPVAAIRAAAESLGTRGSDDARAERLARVLADSGARLDGLVTQFLELARAEAGLPREERGAVDLVALVRGVTGTLAGPRVRVDVEAPASVMLHGVSGRLESVVRNLLDNAVSFAGEGGWVRARVMTIDGRAVLHVEDSGPGIAAADLPRVFERFFTTRGERRGTGLGLALVRAVVEAHGGRVEARSPEGSGAVFVVELPLSPGPAPTPR